MENKLKNENNISKSIVISLISFFSGFALFFILTIIGMMFKWNDLSEGTDNYNPGFLHSLLNNIKILVPFVLCFIIPVITIIKGIICKKNNK